MTEIALERVDEAKQTYHRAKLEMIVRTFALQFLPPALAATVGSVLGIGICAPAGIAAAIASIAASKLLEYEKARAERKKASWSYVLDAAEFLR
jgi:hypothetical protein